MSGIVDERTVLEHVLVRSVQDFLVHATAFVFPLGLATTYHEHITRLKWELIKPVEVVLVWLGVEGGGEEGEVEKSSDIMKVTYEKLPWLEAVLIIIKFNLLNLGTLIQMPSSLC